MKILAIETSTERGSVALLDGATAVARADLSTRERHSAGIVPLLDGLLGASGWTLKDLEAVDGLVVYRADELLRLVHLPVECLRKVHRMKKLFSGTVTKTKREEVDE